MKKVKPLTKKQIAANVARYSKAEAKRTTERKKWEKMVTDRVDNATMYIKPTRYKHDSGFRIFEVGYCTVGKENKVDKKFVHGQCSDHIHTDFLLLLGNGKIPEMNMDCTMDGYIRIWGRGGTHTLLWEDWALSSVAITTPELLAAREKGREDWKKEIAKK